VTADRSLVRRTRELSLVRHLAEATDLP
jgi:hypothetical protein